jgi:Fe(3+) dicitrate transport protein
MSHRFLAPRELAILALVAFIPGLASSQEPAHRGRIRGRVVGPSVADTRELQVGLRDTPFQTIGDSAGRFVLNGVPAATYALTVSRTEQSVPIATRQVRVVADSVVDLVITLPGTAQQLSGIVVAASRPLHVIGHLADIADGVIYSGKKTEVIVMDSLHANVAQDVERQILGRIPGAHFSETEGAGFPSNGVGFRGLDPTQSVEVNTRQNGVNLAADAFGYPETYYTPPAEALERIEVVRGAGSLAFGPQFGGSINYVTRRGSPNTRALVRSDLTFGSYGLVNSFNAIGGGDERVTYYGFLQGKRSDGWRPNSDLWQGTAYASASFRATDRLSLGLDATLSRNRIHMPGGLSDAQFAADPSQSVRARNWLANPWNIVSARASYDLSHAARLEMTLSFQSADRHLVWRNEDGGAAAADAPDPATGELVQREVERETFANATIESRLRVNHSLLGLAQTLVAGLRMSRGAMHRLEGGPGTTGFDFDMTLVDGTWERDLQFVTTNGAVFAENLIHAGRFAFTPGVRMEYIHSTPTGHTENATDFAPRTLRFPLLGIGAEYALSDGTSLYGNVSQAYRPILNAALTSFGSVARVASDLHAAHGYNAELGWRGNVGGALKFDVGAFQLRYRDRIGTRTIEEGSAEIIETANVGTSLHRGIEAYLEIDPFVLGGADATTRARYGDIGVFTSFAFVDATYVSGAFAGHVVEQAPRVVDRLGLSYSRGVFGSTLQASYTARTFGDANNSVLSTDEDGAVGLVPAYTVFDWSARLRVANRWSVDGGVNNLANARYFTKRTGEYPGPGILPGLSRSFYVDLRTTL